MKKTIFFLLAALLISCVQKNENAAIFINADASRENYGEFSILPEDFVKIDSKKIEISPQDENQTYTISGYFNGQIVVTTKNTTLKLKNAFLENTSGKPALKCSSKTEISSAEKSENFIVSSGRGFARNSALSAEKSLVIGGSGSLKIAGFMCHGIEAGDVKIKGRGNLFVQGTKKGSALNCDSLEVESDKTFCAYFLNSKNGIKADKSILVNSGNFFLFDNETALKIDSSKKPFARFLKLSGGEFHFLGNKNKFETGNAALDLSGAKIVEETK